jgi:serine/threonine protein kinase
MAPEVLNRQYTKSCDIWSLGVIAHALLCGELPFSGEDSEDLTDKIQNQDLLLISPAWDEISTEAKDFISGCLEKDTSKRSSLDELLTHDWIDSAFIQSKTVKLKGLKKIRAILEEKFQFQLKTLSKPEPSTAKESFRQ